MCIFVIIMSVIYKLWFLLNWFYKYLSVDYKIIWINYLFMYVLFIVQYEILISMTVSVRFLLPANNFQSILLRLNFVTSMADYLSKTNLTGHLLLEVKYILLIV